MQVVITGGSRGIGAAAVRKFTDLGHQVYFLYEKNHAAAQALQAQTGAAALCADLTDGEAVERAFAQIGRVDVLINNAGICHYGLISQIGEDQWKRLFDVNVHGCYRCIVQALPSMLQRHQGCIINLSSMWGQVGASCEVCYSAAKGAVIAMTKNIALQYTGTDIRCNAVCPGPTAVDRMDGREDALIDQDFFAITDRHMDSSIPFASAEDQANVIAFLASDLSRCITGQAIITDNGRCL